MKEIPIWFVVFRWHEVRKKLMYFHDLWVCSFDMLQVAGLQKCPLWAMLPINIDELRSFPQFYS